MSQLQRDAVFKVLDSLQEDDKQSWFWTNPKKFYSEGHDYFKLPGEAIGLEDVKERLKSKKGYTPLKALIQIEKVLDKGKSYSTTHNIQVVAKQAEQLLKNLRKYTRKYFVLDGVREVFTSILESLVDQKANNGASNSQYLHEAEMRLWPNYAENVKRHMDLTKIKDGTQSKYTFAGEIERDLAVLQANIKAYQSCSLLGQYRKVASGVTDALMELQKSVDDEQKMRGIISVLRKLPKAEEFLQRVPKAAIAYHSVIKHPMDLGTLYKRISAATTREEFFRDLALIWSNAQTFNPPDNPIHKQAKHCQQLSVVLLQYVDLPVPGALRVGLEANFVSKTISTPKPQQVNVPKLGAANPTAGLKVVIPQSPAAKTTVSCTPTPTGKLILRRGSSLPAAPATPNVGAVPARQLNLMAADPDLAKKKKKKEKKKKKKKKKDKQHSLSPSPPTTVVGATPGTTPATPVPSAMIPKPSPSPSPSPSPMQSPPSTPAPVPGRTGEKVVMTISRTQLSMEGCKLFAPGAESILRRMRKADKKNLFGEPPTMLPGYTAEIKAPVGYTTVESKLSAGLYKTNADFIAEMSRIYDNALQYWSKHDDVHRIIPLATGYRSDFLRFVEADLFSKQRRAFKEDREFMCKRALKTIQEFSSDPDVEPIIMNYQGDPEMFYLGAVKNPMWLDKLRLNVQKKMYFDGTISAFRSSADQTDEGRLIFAGFNFKRFSHDFLKIFKDSQHFHHNSSGEESTRLELFAGTLAEILKIYLAACQGDMVNEVRKRVVLSSVYKLEKVEYDLKMNKVALQSALNHASKVLPLFSKTFVPAQFAEIDSDSSKKFFDNVPEGMCVLLIRTKFKHQLYRSHKEVMEDVSLLLKNIKTIQRRYLKNNGLGDPATLDDVEARFRSCLPQAPPTMKKEGLTFVPAASPAHAAHTTPRVRVRNKNLDLFENVDDIDRDWAVKGDKTTSKKKRKRSTSFKDGTKVPSTNKKPKDKTAITSASPVKKRKKPAMSSSFSSSILTDPDRSPLLYQADGGCYMPVHSTTVPLSVSAPVVDTSWYSMAMAAQSGVDLAKMAKLVTNHILTAAADLMSAQDPPPPVDTGPADVNMDTSSSGSLSRPNINSLKLTWKTEQKSSAPPTVPSRKLAPVCSAFVVDSDSDDESRPIAMEVDDLNVNGHHERLRPVADEDMVDRLERLSHNTYRMHWDLNLTSSVSLHTQQVPKWKGFTEVASGTGSFIYRYVRETYGKLHFHELLFASTSLDTLSLDVVVTVAPSGVEQLIAIADFVSEHPQQHPTSNESVCVDDAVLFENRVVHQSELAKEMSQLLRLRCPPPLVWNPQGFYVADRLRPMNEQNKSALLEICLVTYGPCVSLSHNQQQLTCSLREGRAV